MPKERRYTKFKQTDVWNMLANLESALKVQVLRGTAHGSSVSLLRLDTNERLRAVILSRSSDWYTYRLNCWENKLTAVVCGTHDSCIDRPVLAMDTMKWYEPLQMRTDLGALRPDLDAEGKLVPDAFDHARKSHYGHNMFIGALMQGRENARTRLNAMADRTRYRIEAELVRLHTRRQGRPLEVAPDPQPSKADLTLMA
jgi:hypothetical protein